MTSSPPPKRPTGPQPRLQDDATSAHHDPPERTDPQPSPERTSAPILLVSIFVIASCGLIYELLAAALSSYLIGNSIWQFSLVIGLFLTAMGIGAFLSRFIDKQLIRTFIEVEIWVGIIGGSLPMVLFFAFAVLGSFTPLLVAMSLIVGTLVGLEVPLLVRIMRQQFSLKAALGNVLSIDYLGGLAASLLFPLVLVPRLGMVRTGFLFGLFNVAVAIIGMQIFRRQLQSLFRMRVQAVIAIALLTTGLITAGKTTRLLEDLLYDDTIVFAKTTPYQRLIVTRWHRDTRLFINGNIQFSSIDEFRYHEALVHPALGMPPTPPRRILILGGGDGLALREVFKHPNVKHVDLVDLDPEMTRIFRDIPGLAALNKHSLSDPRLQIRNTDAQKFLETSKKRWDIILIDLPDPNNPSLGKLYSKSFYRLAAKHLMPTGVLVTQATSPFYATHAFWCIANTLAATDLTPGGPKLHVLPYRASVPSFGEWGFIMASKMPLDPKHIRLDGVKTRYLTPQLVPTLFVFPKDIAWRKTDVNRLDNQILVKLYEKDYAGSNYAKH